LRAAFLDQVEAHVAVGHDGIHVPAQEQAQGVFRVPHSHDLGIGQRAGRQVIVGKVASLDAHTQCPVDAMVGQVFDGVDVQPVAGDEQGLRGDQVGDGEIVERLPFGAAFHTLDSVHIAALQGRASLAPRHGDQANGDVQLQFQGVHEVHVVAPILALVYKLKRRKAFIASHAQLALADQPGPLLRRENVCPCRKPGAERVDQQDQENESQDEKGREACSVADSVHVSCSRWVACVRYRLLSASP